MKHNALIFLPLLIACDVAESPGTDSSAAGLVEQCVEFRERAATCADATIDVMIAARARHQPRIASAIEAEGLDAIRDVGISELKKEAAGSLDERRDACATASQRMPTTVRPHVEAMSACVEREGCEAFAACVAEPFEQLVLHQSRPPSAL